MTGILSSLRFSSFLNTFGNQYISHVKESETARGLMGKLDWTWLTLFCISVIRQIMQMIWILELLIAETPCNIWHNRLQPSLINIWVAYDLSSLLMLNNALIIFNPFLGEKRYF